MKKIFAISIILLIGLNGNSQIFKKLKDAVAPKTSNGGSFTEQEASLAVKDALSQGLANAVLQLNKTDGFFKDELLKILLPPDAVKLEKKLRGIGMGKQVDQAILSMNRAAEDAAGAAKPIFVNAIKQMTLTDAINIIKGGKTSATDYFKQKTTASLLAAFTPKIKESLAKVDATKYYTSLASTYNKIPFTKDKVNPDLTSFITQKATEALFSIVAKEEEKIRVNPLARTTDILKKVFGSIKL